MKLKTLEINNYRQFKKGRINFDNDLTIFAGANNSGKTSIIELFKRLFDDKNFSKDDISTSHFAELHKIFKSKIEKVMIPADEATFRENVKLSFPKKENEIFIAIQIKLEITYEEAESISLFSDYLMELDSANRSFYFVFNYELDLTLLTNNFGNNALHYLSLIQELSSLSKKPKTKENKRKIDNLKLSLNEEIDNTFISSFKQNVYFTDKAFNNPNLISISEFQSLFNFNYLKATRVLNDEKTDNYYSISKELLEHFQLSSDWAEFKTQIIAYIKDGLNQQELNEKVKTHSLAHAQETLKKIEKYFDYNKGDFSLQTDIPDNLLIEFLKSTLKTYYEYSNGVKLQEFSQGLGISNLIFMCLKVEGFIKKYISDVVNIFVIEEPEAHMHPQMERLLVKFVTDLLSSETSKPIQGCITTHSNEIVKSASLKNIRVLRIHKELSSSIYDLNEFYNSIDKDEQRHFFTFLFSINYSDLIFANKIIMYEGDTEKLYIERLLTEPQFEKLANQYISFVQVGGAYTHWYRSLIYFLKIKTLIITDIDYEKKWTSSAEIIKSSITTNGGVNKYYSDYVTKCIIEHDILPYCTSKCRNHRDNCFFTKQELDRLDFIQSDLRKAPCKNKIKRPDYSKITRFTIKDIYLWQYNDDSKMIRVVTQCDTDGFTRTLEEAMLCKLFNITIDVQNDISWWRQKITDAKLNLILPNKRTLFSVREVIAENKDNKTNFMYSIILSNNHIEALPEYIKRGLEWLNE